MHSYSRWERHVGRHVSPSLHWVLFIFFLQAGTIEVGASPAAETSPLDLLFPSSFLLFGVRDGSAGKGRERVLRSLKQDRPSTPNLIPDLLTDQRTRSRFVLQPYQCERSGEERRAPPSGPHSQSGMFTRPRHS